MLSDIERSRALCNQSSLIDLDLIVNASLPMPTCLRAIVFPKYLEHITLELYSYESGSVVMRFT